MARDLEMSAAEPLHREYSAEDYSTMSTVEGTEPEPLPVKNNSRCCHNMIVLFGGLLLLLSGFMLGRWAESQGVSLVPQFISEMAQRKDKESQGREQAQDGKGGSDVTDKTDGSDGNDKCSWQLVCVSPSVSPFPSPSSNETSTTVAPEPSPNATMAPAEPVTVPPDE
eukprot:gb/GEZN01016691.1/.p1 GENE.gb/GEZN01016691.1/~~gb/GEZN01016691.1/.p1  ORF type:complete len:168 (-),score=22.61 gb/GEZN01016691.1/:221-724(-)